MIKVNASLYAAAQDALQAGKWKVDPHRGLLKPDGSLAGSPNTCGYLRVSFQANGRQLQALCHRIVWEAINGTIPEGMYVNHIDGDKTNNALENLELVTHAANMAHAHRTKLIGDGFRHSVLTVEDARAICARALSGENVRAIARDYGVDRGVVYRIRQGVRWASVTADIRLASAA